MNLIIVLVIFNEPGTLLMDIDVIVGSLNRDKEMQNMLKLRLLQTTVISFH